MAFTTIHNTTSWQNLQIAKQIRVAYNKRRTACGLSTYPDPDNSIKVIDFVYAMQSGIEEMIELFADTEESEFSGLIALPTNYSSVAAGMTKAELTAAGFWRRTSGHAPYYNYYDNYPIAYNSGWSYGKIQSRDQAGPWLFIDIEKVLSSLTRMIGQSTPEGTGYTAQYTDSGKNWVFPDDDPVTGGVDTTPINAPNSYVIARVDVGKTNYPYDPLINVAQTNYNLANFRIYAGHPVVGTNRAVQFVALPTGNDALTAITGVKDINVTVSNYVSIGSQTYFNKWFPKSPNALGTLAWQTMLDQIVDEDVPVNNSVLKYLDLTYNSVCSVADYSFVDGATS